MKTLIEIATGNVVDTGDMITVDGVKQILKDLDVPKLIAKGILAFASYSSPSVDEPIENETTEDIEKHILEINDLKLKSVFLNWGSDKGYCCEQCLMEDLATMWELHPVSLLQIALKQLANELNDPTDIPDIGYIISLGDGMIHTISTDRILTFEHFAFFSCKEHAEYALTVCEELIDKLF